MSFMWVKAAMQYERFTMQSLELHLQSGRGTASNGEQIGDSKYMPFSHQPAIVNNMCRAATRL